MKLANICFQLSVKFPYETSVASVFLKLSRCILGRPAPTPKLANQHNCTHSPVPKCYLAFQYHIACGLNPADFSEIACPVYGSSIYMVVIHQC